MGKWVCIDLNKSTPGAEKIKGGWIPRGKTSDLLEKKYWKKMADES
jgi:hypothetical protein